eukprot:Amastigsp_a340512_12.p3 type:complete len:131 gc:universal Amastigsp_a340512_12:730-1122(+)
MVYGRVVAPMRAISERRWRTSACEFSMKPLRVPTSPWSGDARNARYVVFTAMASRIALALRLWAEVVSMITSESADARPRGISARSARSLSPIKEPTSDMARETRQACDFVGERRDLRGRSSNFEALRRE